VPVFENPQGLTNYFERTKPISEPLSTKPKLLMSRQLLNDGDHIEKEGGHEVVKDRYGNTIGKVEKDFGGNRKSVNFNDGSKLDIKPDFRGNDEVRSKSGERASIDSSGDIRQGMIGRGRPVDLNTFKDSDEPSSTRSSEYSSGGYGGGDGVYTPSSQLGIGCLVGLVAILVFPSLARSCNSVANPLMEDSMNNRPSYYRQQVEVFFGRSSSQRIWTFNPKALPEGKGGRIIFNYYVNADPNSHMYNYGTKQNPTFLETDNTLYTAVYFEKPAHARLYAIDKATRAVKWNCQLWSGKGKRAASFGALVYTDDVPALTQELTFSNDAVSLGLDNVVYVVDANNGQIKSVGKQLVPL